MTDNAQDAHQLAVAFLRRALDLANTPSFVAGDAERLLEARDQTRGALDLLDRALAVRQVMRPKPKAAKVPKKTWTAPTRKMKAP